jgi:hypothetical protein
LSDERRRGKMSAFSSAAHRTYKISTGPNANTRAADAGLILRARWFGLRQLMRESGNPRKMNIEPMQVPSKYALLISKERSGKPQILKVSIPLSEEFPTALLFCHPITFTEAIVSHPRCVAVGESPATRKLSDE